MNATHRVIRPDDPEPNHLIGAEALVRLFYGNKILLTTRRNLSPEWQQMVERAESSAGLDREAKQADAFKIMNGFKGDRATIGKAMSAALYEALGQAKTIPPIDEVDPSAPSVPLSFRAAIMGARAFNSTVFALEWLVKQILVMGQPCIVGAPKKSMKTTITCDLAVSAAAGLPFLGKFEVPEPVGVLVLSGESGGATLQETLRRICRQKGINLDDLEGKLFVGDQLPQLSSELDMAELAAFIRENGIKLVIIDPLYLCMCGGLPGGRRIDPANLFDVGPLLMSVTNACLGAGATPMLVHHFRKNAADPYKTPELDDLAYAGIQEYARQTLLFRRREEFKPGTGEHKLWMVAGGSVGFTNEYAVDICEGVIDDDFRGRFWDVSVKLASEAREATTEASKVSKADKVQERDEIKSDRVKADAFTAWERLDELIRNMGRPLTKTEWKDGMKGWDSKRFGPVFSHLLEHKLIESVTFTKPVDGRSARPFEGWRPARKDSRIDPDDSRIQPENPTMPPSQRYPDDPGGSSPVGGGPRNPSGYLAGALVDRDSVETAPGSIHKDPPTELPPSPTLATDRNSDPTADQIRFEPPRPATMYALGPAGNVLKLHRLVVAADRVSIGEWQDGRAMELGILWNGPGKPRRQFDCHRFADPASRYLLVLDGADHPRPPDVRPVRQDDQLTPEEQTAHLREFDRLIDQHVAKKGVKVLVDWRDLTRGDARDGRR